MPIENYLNIEFGIARIEEGATIYSRIPIDNSVREVLLDMLQSFYQVYFDIEGDPELFSPSEKYSNTEKLFVPNDYAGVEEAYSLFNAENIPIVHADLGDMVHSSEYYFAIFYNINGSKQIAIKRPTSFKGLLKKKLISFADDTLKSVEDDIFKLDADFDFVLNHDRIDILHPIGFVYLNDIDEQVLEAAVNVANSLGQRIQFVGFNLISDQIGRSKTCARLVTSINARADLELTDMNKLINHCHALGVELRMENGLYVPEDSSIEDFLRVLDRREYEVDLTTAPSEIYIAGSRKKK